MDLQQVSDSIYEVFFLPPLVQEVFKRRNLFPKNKIGQTLFNTGKLILSLLQIIQPKVSLL